MRANLAQARANLAFTEADLTRGQSLLTNKTITEQAYDQRTQAKAVASAAVAAQEAMVHSAELDLDQYSELRSPIDGRIGDRRVAVGNLVTGGTGGSNTLLATVVSVDPIRFEFTFDEQSYLRYVRFASASKDVAALNGNVPVTLELIDENDFKHSGKIDFVDNAINQSTGHDPRPRGVRQCRRPFHPWHVRPPPRAWLAALYRAARSRCGDRLGAGAQICAGGR